ncbi:MAG: hypothetical protein ACTSP9_06570 [Promethearchaeota archaeon]
MDVEKLLAEVSRSDWGGHPVSSLRPHLVELYSLIKWFFEKTTNEYLGQNESSVLKSIKTDNVPKVFREVLLKAEQAGKNRPNVIKALE